MIDPLAELERAIAKEGVRGLARRAGCSPGYISLARMGKTTVGPVLLDALGLECIVIYRRKKR